MFNKSIRYQYIYDPKTCIIRYFGTYTLCTFYAYILYIL